MPIAKYGPLSRSMAAPSGMASRTPQSAAAGTARYQGTFHVRISSVLA
jgi:hypothetical protein